ncbi:MAG: nucleotide exchange factor GrpE [Methylibium sp.]
MKPENETQEQDPPESLEALKQQLEHERERAEANLGSWQRTAADFQNYKRRVEQEREEIARMSNAALIINLLPLLDDLQRALDSVDARLAGMTWLDGVRLIERKFQALLDLNGVTVIEADGQDFDPNVHEAVTFGPGEENKVIAVVQKGYRLGGRVIRPAMVVVGRREQQ